MLQMASYVTEIKLPISHTETLIRNFICPRINESLKKEVRLHWFARVLHVKNDMTFSHTNRKKNMILSYYVFTLHYFPFDGNLTSSYLIISCYSS